MKKKLRALQTKILEDIDKTNEILNNPLDIYASIDNITTELTDFIINKVINGVMNEIGEAVASSKNIKEAVAAKLVIIQELQSRVKTEGNKSNALHAIILITCDSLINELPHLVEKKDKAMKKTKDCDCKCNDDTPRIDDFQEEKTVH